MVSLPARWSRRRLPAAKNKSQLPNSQSPRNQCHEFGSWKLRSWELTLRVLAPLLLSSAALVSLTAHVRISTKVTWDREIAPIVQARCVTCHRDGGRAPMSLETYEQARPWAKAIKEEVLTRRMPRWHVVRGYGDFANDPSLSPFEIALIASWADGGSPKTLPGVKPAPPTRAPSRKTPAQTRSLTLACSAGPLPQGRLLALKPVLPAGASVRISLTQRDGTEEPLVWVRDFEPDFAETYWLRTPVTVSRGMRMLADTNGCSVELTYLPRQSAERDGGRRVRTNR
jgi:hypothetical protein